MNKMYSEQGALKTLENLRKRKSDERTLSMIKAKIDESLETFSEDLEHNYVCDIYKSKYSIDKKRLLWAPKNCRQFSVKEGTEIVLCKMESEFTEIINIPDSVLAIGDNAFYNCTKLNTIIWRPGLKIIGSNAFSGCQVSVLLIPDGVLEVRERAFSCNEKLTTVYLPDSLIAVGKGVFSDCPILSKIYVSHPKELISKLLPEYLQSKIVSIGDTDWKFDTDAIKNNKEQWDEKRHNASYNHFEDTSDRNIWDAMTDGMYGDYPDEGYNGDYETMGR